MDDQPAPPSRPPALRMVLYGLLFVLLLILLGLVARESRVRRAAPPFPTAGEGVILVEPSR